MKNLKQQLKEWDANIATSESRKEEIKKKIIENLDKPLIYDDYNSVDPYFHIHKKVIYFAGIAASLCFAFLLGTRFNKSENAAPVSLSKNNLAHITTLSSNEIAKLKRIVSEIDYLFPEGVKSITQENCGDIKINTEKKQGLDNIMEKILIRYIVLKRSSGEKKWKKVYVSNVVANPGEPIQLEGDCSGSLWIYPADRNIYAMQSDLKIRANGEFISLKYIGGQHLRTSQIVKDIKNPDTEYKVYQILMRI
jgi:hypothetical protein